MEIINNKWTFPESIPLEIVPEFQEKFNNISIDGNIIFDLSATRDVHSSFIGFLLNTKNQLNKKGGTLILHLSTEVEKLFFMMNIRNYFLPEISAVFDKKSA